MGIVDVDLGSVITAGGNLIDDLFTSDEERMALGIQEKQIDAGLMMGQMEINKVEANHKSIFVAGWRPFIGWVGGFALAYKFLFYPLLGWAWQMAIAFDWIPATVTMPPTINATELYPIIMGMIGLGTMRTIEGVKGVKSTSLSPPVPKKESGFKWPWSHKK